MKKILFAGIALLTALTVSAKTPAVEHLAFMGIPINGTVNRFAAKMQAQNFALVATIDNAALLSGMFAGYDDCQIEVIANPSKPVHEVAVMFPACSAWADLEANYIAVKQLTTRTYGEPLMQSEKFESIYAGTTDDNLKMMAVSLGKCTYQADYILDEGYIILYIAATADGEAYVSLIYYDAANGGNPFSEQDMQTIETAKAARAAQQTEQ